MNGGWDFTAGARHSSIRDEGNLETPVLQDTQGRAQLVKFRHSVCCRALEPDNHHDVFFQFACLESGHGIILIIKDAGGRFDGPAGFIHRAGFHRCSAEVTLQQTQAAVRLERIADWFQNGFIQTGRRSRFERELALGDIGLLRPVPERCAVNGFDIAVRQSGIDQFADDKRHAARCRKIVHVASTIGINGGDQRDRFGQLVHIVPVQYDAGRSRNRGEMQHMIGGAASCEQSYDRVDDRLFINAMAEWSIVRRGIFADTPSDFGHPMHRRTGQFLAKLVAGIHKAAARNMQSHHLHHHLVGVGCAKKGASPGAMIACTLGVEQFLLANLAFGKQLSDANFFFIGKTGRHWSGRNQDSRKMTKTQRADQ